MNRVLPLRGLFLWSSLLTLAFIAQLAAGQPKVIDSLDRVVALNRRDTVELEAMLNLANEYLRRDLVKVESYARQSIVLAKSLYAVRGLGSGYSYMVASFHGRGMLDSATRYLDLFQKHSAANPTYKRMTVNFNQSAGLYYKNIGQPKVALTYLLKNLEMDFIAGENRAGLFLNIGNTYNDLGNYRKCTEYFLQSLALFEKLNHKRGQSFVLHSLGVVSSNLKQLATAQNYLERSLEMKKELKDNRGMVNTIMSLGDVSKELGQYQAAEDNYMQTLKLAQEIKLPAEQSRSLHQLALLYKQMGEFEKAREYMTQSLTVGKTTGDSLLVAKIRSGLAGINMKEEETMRNEKALLRDLSTIIQAGDRSAEALEYGRLAEYYSLKKQYEKAFYYLKKEMALTDSIKGSVVLIEMKNLEEKYNSEKKEQEIALLKKDQELQKLALESERANTTLIIIVLISVVIISIILTNRYRVMNRIKRQLEMEKMRQGIARDLHDDIGSTLSSINIMSQIALQDSANGGANLKKIAMHSSRLMENMSDIVWSINPQNDSLEQVTAKMKEFAAEILEPKEISYTFAIDEAILSTKLDVERRKNIFLIFKEAVNNAAKYSGAASVDIRLSWENGILNLSVVDNGKGFDAATIAQGNGLKNMTDRAQGMKGQLTQQSTLGKGSSVLLEVPLT